MTEWITDTIICIIGFGVFFGVCALAELLGDWMAESAPDWLWLPLFLAIPAGLVVYLWRWYRETVEREAAEQEEGEDNALL